MDEFIELNGKIYLLGDGSIKHCETPPHVDEVKKRTGISHAKLTATNRLDEWARSLDMHCVPRDVHDENGLVINPETGKRRARRCMVLGAPEHGAAHTATQEGLTLDRYPVPEKRRKRFEWIHPDHRLDHVRAAFIGGVYALIGTPTTVVDALRGAMWLVLVWSGLLCFGGLAGFIGRAHPLLDARSPRHGPHLLRRTHLPGRAGKVRVQQHHRRRGSAARSRCDGVDRPPVGRAADR